MAMDNIAVRFNNSQPGDQSLKELSTTIGIDIGQTPGVAEIVRDAQGALVSVILRMDEAVSQIALDKIVANGGVATTFICPEQFMWKELSDDTPDGITYDLTLSGPPDQNQIIAVRAGGGGILGRLENKGAGNVYVGGNKATAPGAAIIAFANKDKTGPWTIPTTATLVCNLNATDSITMVLQNDIVVPIVTNFLQSSLLVYLDVDGNVYKRYSKVSGVTSLINTYEDACAAGAL